MNKNILIGIIAVLVVAVGIFAFLQLSRSSDPSINQGPSTKASPFDSYPPAEPVDKRQMRTDEVGARDAAVDEQAKRIAGASYAGSWLNKKNILQIGVTDKSKIKPIKEAADDWPVDVVVVDYSASMLDKAFDDVSDIVDDNTKLVGRTISLNIEKNRIDVNIPPAKLQASHVDMFTEMHPSITSEELTEKSIQKRIDGVVDKLEAYNSKISQQHSGQTPIANINLDAPVAYASDVPIIIDEASASETP